MTSLFVGKFWEKAGKNRPTQEDIDMLYKRKDKAPEQEIEFDDGTKEHLWNTFGEEQIDINVKSKVANEFFKETLIDMVKHGADMIRLDAFMPLRRLARTTSLLSQKFGIF